jgi:hypothetical protein
MRSIEIQSFSISKELERGIKRLPIEKQKEFERKVKEYYGR